VKKNSLIIENNLHFFRENLSFKNSNPISDVITALGECFIKIFPGHLVLGAFAKWPKTAVSLIASVGPSARNN
jgi:hypothetical protein